ncbi:hypothetical protein DH2020_035648 [Rehmannia glutinosa]|uniref:Retrotransposon Copia-like N-terminal domain-containing protein n=1 Tax=Rehmannia glutinosa TaxID=99300 RepID=A0ABR0V981_REHGL
MASLTLPSLNTLTIKLDRNNYNFWRAQVIATATAHGFDELLFGHISAPPKYLDDDSEESSLNPEYSIWLRKDQFLYSWMLSSISEGMLGHIQRCVSSSEIWHVLENLFRSNSKARVMHLRLLLQTTKKGDLSIEEYVLKMNSIASDIQSAGQSVPDDDLVLHILSGLGPEFESVIVNLTSQIDKLSLSEVQFALQTHEMRLKQFHIPESVPAHPSPSLHMATRRPFTDFRTQRGGFTDRGGSTGGRFRGRGRCFSLIWQLR